MFVCVKSYFSGVVHTQRHIQAERERERERVKSATPNYRFYYLVEEIILCVPCNSIQLSSV